MLRASSSSPTFKPSLPTAAADSSSPMLSSSTTAHSAASPLPGPASANPKPRSRLLRLRAASPVPSAALSARGRPPMCTVRASSAAGAGGWGAEAVGELATERLVEVAQRAADAAGEVLRKYFRQRVEIIDKEDHSACYASLYCRTTLVISFCFRLGYRYR